MNCASEVTSLAWKTEPQGPYTQDLMSISSIGGRTAGRLFVYQAPAHIPNHIERSSGLIYNHTFAHKGKGLSIWGADFLSHHQVAFCSSAGQPMGTVDLTRALNDQDIQGSTHVNPHGSARGVVVNRIGPLKTDTLAVCCRFEGSGGHVVLTGGRDGVVRMWDLRSRSFPPRDPHFLPSSSHTGGRHRGRSAGGHHHGGGAPACLQTARGITCLRLVGGAHHESLVVVGGMNDHLCMLDLRQCTTEHRCQAQQGRAKAGVATEGSRAGTGLVRTYKGHVNSFHRIRFELRSLRVAHTHHGRHAEDILCCGGLDGMVRLWSLGNSRPVQCFHVAPMTRNSAAGDPFIRV